MSAEPSSRACPQSATGQLTGIGGNFLRRAPEPWRYPSACLEFTLQALLATSKRANPVRCGLMPSDFRGNRPGVHADAVASMPGPVWLGPSSSALPAGKASWLRSASLPPFTRQRLQANLEKAPGRRVAIRLAQGLQTEFGHDAEVKG